MGHHQKKICITGISEGKEKEKGTESMFKAIMADTNGGNG